MNNMPTMPVNETAQTEKQETALNTPEHQETETQAPVESNVLEKPQMQNHSTTISNKLEIPVPKEGIKVVALRKGFYNQNRINEGYTFYVKRFEELGTWMRCEDPQMEKKRQEHFKNKLKMARK